MVTHPSFLPQQFGVVSGNDSSPFSMHLHKRLIPTPSASNPLEYKAHPMANTSQPLDLKRLHREIHGMAEQMRIMNENNACLIQHLVASNPLPPAAPPVLDMQQSHWSGDDDSLNNYSIGQARNRRPSPSPRHGRSSSLSES